MFDLMLHVLSQFNYRLVVPVDDAIDVHSLDTYVEAPVHSSSDSSRPQPRLRAGETDNFLVFYEALVLWGYTATAATQDQTEGKIIFIKFVDRHPLHSVLSLRHRPTPHHCQCLAQPGRHTARPMLVLLPSKPHTVWYQHWLTPETMAGAKHWYPQHNSIVLPTQHVWYHQVSTRHTIWLVSLGWRCHKLSTQNLKQLSTALTGRVAWVNVQCFKCLGLTFR
ncbi:hypothetical protein Pcinc_032063 [Petrolisthes cinctipes]|uniref:Uncharacterized protein n=1 Tax=Petrolisthes cinctipes TaxID=88211 RepID=A0AAE1EVD3_PETCI|nr:hypothetical protein Pcinc_043546 [Petrolisthes cinctipes]KAK3862040.1 hypothetical protein Pcinc_032063 [Petrolisthes cinctipes]